MPKSAHLPTSAGGWVRLVFEVIGVTVIAGPAIVAVADDIQKKTPASIPNDILFAYTGLGGTTMWNSQAAATGIGAVVGGAVLVELGKWLGKQVR